MVVLRHGSYAIETERLLLRLLAPGDLDAIHRVWTDPGVRRYLWDGEEISRERAESVLARGIESSEGRGFGLFAVIPKGRRELIGFCGFWPVDDDPSGAELAYGIATPHWGKGLATEAARAAIRHGFEELGFERVAASADTENAASLRVMQKAGMRYEKRAFREGRDMTYYAISREDFRAATGPSAAPG